MNDEKKSKEPLIDRLPPPHKGVDGLRKSSDILHNQSQQLLDSLFGNSPTAIHIIQNGIVQYANHQFQTYTGYSKAELLGMDYVTLVVPEDRDEVRDNALKILRGDLPSPHEYRIVTKNGKTGWVAETIISMQFQGQQAALGSFIDITEHKKIEQTLKESEERYRILFESAEEGILVIDSDTKTFTYANPAICRMLRYSQEELRGMDRSAIHPMDEWDHILSEIEAQATGEKALASDIPCITKDGTVIYADISATKALINMKECTIGFFRDITEHKRIEDELSESEEKLRAIFESVADGVMVTDLEGTITTLNDAAVSLYGYSNKEELLGRSALDFVSPKDRAKALENMKQTLQYGRSGNTEYTLLTKGGREIDAELSSALLRDKSGKPAGFIALTKDITERKKTEEEILQRNQELAALHQVLTSITHTLDLDKVIKEIVSQVGKALEANYTSIVMVNEDGSLGVGSEEFVGIPSLSTKTQPHGVTRRIVDITPPPITARPHGVTRKILDSGEPVIIDDVDTVEGTNPVLLAAGIRSYAGVPIKSKNTIIGVLFVHNTRRNAFAGKTKLLVAFADEAAIAIENAQLYKEASTVGALREADRLKTELLANVSHDLRTPLTSIKGYTTTILRHYEKLTDKEKHDFLHEIDLASDRLTELIENLLQLSKLEAGGFLMNKEPIAIASIVNNAIEDTEQKAKNYHFATRFAEFLPLVEADPRRIRQLLDNLLSNAVKYSPEDTEISVQCESNKQELIVRVHDQGIGISHQELDKVFERFYQAASGQSHKGGGVGLGLAICKGIIDAHGGRIWAESELGKGSVFTFTLPLSPQETKSSGQSAG